MKANKYELEFSFKKQLTHETYEFYFKRPKELSFKAGQYMKYSLDISKSDDRGASRYFTISSSPLNKEYITITTRVIQSSFKIALSNMEKGDKIRSFGPLGYFTFDPKSRKNKIFLAGGIGVTPYHSILKTIQGKRSLANIILFDSWPRAKDAVYLSELKEVEARNKNIKVIYTLTQENKEGFEYGRISPQLIEKYMPNYKDAEFFVVGSEEVEAALLKMVKDMGVAEENIFSENFPGY